MNIKNLFNLMPRAQSNELSPKAKELAEKVKREKSTSEIAISSMKNLRKEKAPIQDKAQESSFEDQLKQRHENAKRLNELAKQGPTANSK